MPKEASTAPANEQETPVAESQETPEQQPDTVDWQKRYTDLQPEYTRASQEAAQYRQVVEALRSDDPEIRAQAAEVLGLEFDDDEPDEPLDEVEALKRELQEIKSWRDEEVQHRQTTRQSEAELDYMDQQFDALEKREGREFTDKEVEAVARLAQQIRDDEGRPDVDGAFKFLLEYVDEATPRRVASKKAAQVQAGRAGSKEFDFRNKEERANRMAAIIDAHKN